ncbi:MAG: hypothetical protein ABJA80_04415 [bacterium]
MLQSPTHPSGGPDADQRHESTHRPVLAGITVREEDIETVKGIRAVAYLFRGMAILLLLLAVVQVVSAVTSTVQLSVGVVFAEEVRLIIFAGLLWGAGDLAVLWIKSHYDIRATRILVTRIAYMMRQMGEADGRLAGSGDTRSDRET